MLGFEAVEELECSDETNFCGRSTDLVKKGVSVRGKGTDNAAVERDFCREVGQVQVS